jgi:hypothetical protein
MTALEQSRSPAALWRRFTDWLRSRPKTRKVLYWAPFLAMGPISGPLAEGVVRNLRKGDRILAGIYAFAVVETFVVLPILVAGATLNLAQMQEAMAEERRQRPPVAACKGEKPGPDLPGKLEAIAARPA